MAKQRSTAADHSSFASLTAKEASAALVAVLNGSPTTPSLEEIHAIIERVEKRSGRQPKQDAELLVELGAAHNSLVVQLQACDGEEGQQEVRLSDAAESLATRMIDTPATTFAGIRSKAAAFKFYATPATREHESLDVRLLASLLDDVERISA